MTSQGSNGDISELVEQVKAKCRMTWDDPSLDTRLAEDVIPTAIAIIRFRVGIPDDADLDFAAPGVEHALLLNYCFYAWHNAEDDFFINYASDFAIARRKWEVANAQNETPAP